MAMTLITTNPDSTDVATVSFTSSIDSTYKLYIFKFYDINAATDQTNFTFQGSIDAGSNYNVTITSTAFDAYHDEADGTAEMVYETGNDQAQGTAFQIIGRYLGNGADESCAGELFLFNPSNTTYVKHFYSRLNLYMANDYTQDVFTAGYFNTTDNIDAIQFKMASGNMDGVIKMYGVG